MVLKYLSVFTLLVTVFSQISCNISIEPEPSVDPGLVLWYDKPASDWTEALPIGNGRLAAMILKVITEGGEVSTTDNQLVVTNARAATLKLVAATNFVDYQDISAHPGERCANDLKKLDGKSYEDSKEDHVQDYHQLFNRVTFDLGVSEISKRPTNERLISFKQDQDPALVALLYQFYTRY